MNGMGGRDTGDVADEPSIERQDSSPPAGRVHEVVCQCIVVLADAQS
jgi:hypothetical protein